MPPDGSFGDEADDAAIFEVEADDAAASDVAEVEDEDDDEVAAVSDVSEVEVEDAIEDVGSAVDEKLMAVDDDEEAGV